VILTVANVADSALQSYLYLDYVTAGRVCIRPLEPLINLLPGDTWFNNTPVHCYLDAVTATFGYDPDGVRDEKIPNADQHSCVEVKQAGSDEIIAAANAVTPFYQPCPLPGYLGYFCVDLLGPQVRYNVVLHQCCHFVDAALTNAGSPGVVSYFPGYELYPDIAPPPR
jgi:hypothetical protein